MNRVFVYGTLMAGEYNNERFMRRESARYEARGQCGGIRLYVPSHGAYPIAVPRSGSEVSGEVWMVDDDTLDVLDRMECGAGYERVSMMVETRAGRVECGVYVQRECDLRPGGEWVQDGAWRRWRIAHDAALTAAQDAFDAALDDTLYE